MMFVVTNINAIAVLITALGIAVPAILGAIATFIIAIRRDIAVLKADVRTIEVATNSMKDALIKSTGDAEFARGGKEERDKQAVNAGIAAVARAEGKTGPAGKDV